jgi:pyruvate dehydrogenase E1 component beta subunit
MKGDLVDDAGAVDIDRAAVRRAGTDVTLVTYGARVHTCLAAAEALAADGVSAEVIDLRTLRPLDLPTVLASVARTHRAVVVDEAWRTGGIGAEVAASISELAFWDLDAPVGRVATREVPIPYAVHLEEAALPQPDDVVAAVRAVLA